jgi:hypothetical protein
MNETHEALERQVTELRSEVARLRRIIKNGLIAIGAVVVALCVPGLGVVAIALAVFVFIFGTIGAFLGSWTGRAIRRARREHPPRVSD